jgi:hypothetical protein
MGRGSEAPQARQMVARGECERSEHAAPGSQIKAREPRRGDRHAGPFLSAFQACTSFLERSRGYALRARPWLPSAAPAALSRPSAAPAARSHDHLPRLRRALTTICRACGALTTICRALRRALTTICRALRRSHDHLPRACGALTTVDAPHSETGGQ